MEKTLGMSGYMNGIQLIGSNSVMTLMALQLMIILVGLRNFLTMGTKLSLDQEIMLAMEKTLGTQNYSSGVVAIGLNLVK